MARRLPAAANGSSGSAAWSAPPGAGRTGQVRILPRGRRLSPPRSFLHRRNTRLSGLFSAFLATFLAINPAFATVVSNTASLDFLNSAGVSATLASNVVTTVVRTPSDLELVRVAGNGDFQHPVGPSACFQGGSFVPLADPILLGGITIDPVQPQPLSPATDYNLGEPVFVRVADADQNLDVTAVEYVAVDVSIPETGDTESVRLSETGPDTGVFAGYLQTSRGAVTGGDCVLQGQNNSMVQVAYTDPADAADGSLDAARLDPASVVFESRSGSVIDGATIELVNALTGLPATVYGNDGLSDFPATIVSGTSVTDSGGTVYQFGVGEYRFPVVPAGDYRLIVVAPPGYTAPSGVAEQDLQALPGAPYSLGAASFANSFSHGESPTVAFDLPVDPLDTALFLAKSSLTTIAAPGDFVRYELAVENTSSGGVAANLRVMDQLPAGTRYVAGSTSVDGADVPDPTVSADLRILEFQIGDLAGGTRSRIHYVVEIIGGARNTELVNTATAIADGGLVSNQSAATIRLTEDLFRSTATLIGRVVEGACNQDSFAEDQGVANVRVYLEDGRYAVSDEGGRFHFEGLKPGGHVAQLDPESVADYFDIVGCDTAVGFSGRADSQFVRLSRGGLHRADFFLRRKEAPEGHVDIEMQNTGTANADEVAYILTLNGTGNIRISNLNLMMLLPDGVAFRSGSLKIDGEQVANPRVAGPSLTIDIEDRIGEWTTEVRLTGVFDKDTVGDLETRAFARFDSPIQTGQQTPIVETRMQREPAVVENEGYVLNLKFDILSATLSTDDQRQLRILTDDWRGVENIQIATVGHSDSNPITRENQHLFADNYVLSQARARAAAGFVANALNVAPENIQVEGRGPDDPVASNATADGRRSNRRVEMILSGLRPTRPSFLEVTRKSSGTVIAQTKGAVPGMEEERLRQQMRDAQPDVTGMPSSQVEPAVNSVMPGLTMLLPSADFQPAIPATKVAIKHNPQDKLRVLINGSLVNALNFNGIAVNDAGTVAISSWHGVRLKDGVNEIRVDVETATGDVEVLERRVNYSGAPIRGEVIRDMSVLVADGKTRPVIAVRMFDRSGKPSRAGTVGTFQVESPYRSWWEVEDDRKNPIVNIGNREPSYRVGEDGIALIELAPTSHSGEAILTFNFNSRRQQEIRTWLSPEPRDWILVGFAEGTAGYGTLAENQTAALDAGHADGYYDDGRVAFFAKGQIRGEYLLTMAYDSARERDQSKSQFETQVDPDAYYTLYADKSEQRFEAASQRKLYLKLERKQFFALFGDFDTGLSFTELSRYERRFNGFKSSFRGEHVGYTVFAAETDQSFVRDEIRGDGTSGLYYLSSAPIIGNSETIRIEVRDRFDTGQIVSSSTLARHLDYNLDVLDGSLFFKKPIPSRDESFNPIFIVVEYESFSDANEDVVAGGRGSVRMADDRVEIGLTHVSDNKQGAESDLTGVDVRWQVSPETLVRAEFASSSRTETGTELSGYAHAISLEHHGENTDVRAYIKEVEDEFGLGQQAAAEQGVRKVGVDARARVGERFFVDGEASWQQNLRNDTVRSTARGLVRYENQGFTASTGLVHAQDEFADGVVNKSDLAEFGVSQQIFGRLTLRANGNVAVSEDAENIDYPTSVVFGADLKIVDGVDLFAEYEDASGRDISSTMSRLGVRAKPWNRAQVNSALTSESSEFGPRLFANLGLVQGFQLNENWMFDLGIDQTRTIVNPDARLFDENRELASGSFNDDFVAVFLGATYNAEVWSANSRIEYRDSDNESRRTLIAGWYRDPQTGHGMSAGLTLFQSESISGSSTSSANFKYGWAWRKAGGHWSFLNRIDLIFEDTTLTSQKELSRRLINNLNANRRIGEASQLSLQYAFKYVRNTFDGSQFGGFTDLIGADLRRGFARRWDAGIHTSIYHSYQSRVLDYGLGVDIGYNILDNMWLTLGYNLAGFHDSDFTAARYTAQGPFLRISVKADQQTLQNIAGQR